MNAVVIGKCPVCGEGDIIKTETGYRCNSKKKMPDGKKCKFSIHKVQHGVELDDSLVRALITEGRTQELRMTNYLGQPFNACFVIRDNKVDLDIQSHSLNGKCPVCGGNVLKTSKGFACENSIKGEKTCDFHVTGIIYGRKISDKEIEDLLAGHAQILDGFTTLDGRVFSSVLTINEDGTVGLEPKITTCPVCGGNILVSPIAFNCSNYKNPDVKCQFSLWRNIAGHEVTNEEMRQICEEGQTREPVELYKSNGAVFYKRLCLSPDKTKIIKL